jgi:putative transcriptional regulator
LSSEDSVTVLLHRTGKLDQPIALTRRLFAAGQTLKGAHGVANRLAADGSAVCAVAKDTDLPALARDLAAMNVRLSRRRAPDSAPDIAAFRAAHNLSQREFADLMGIDVRTLQNWEQGRNRPDPAVLSLMRIFAHAPDVFEAALSEPIL